jgi:hypothetical protein
MNSRIQNPRREEAVQACYKNNRAGLAQTISLPDLVIQDFCSGESNGRSTQPPELVEIAHTRSPRPPHEKTKTREKKPASDRK